MRRDERQKMIHPLGDRIGRGVRLFRTQFERQSEFMQDGLGVC